MFERLYSSRIDRIGFFLGSLYLTLPLIIVILAYALLNAALGSVSFEETNPLRTAVNISLFLVGAATIIALPFLSVSLYIRRLHDMNQTGWLSLLAFIPFVSWIVWLVLQFYPGTRGDNNYGPVRTSREFMNVLIGEPVAPEVTRAFGDDATHPVVPDNPDRQG